jgi:MYXO-CTERM domain-containing protein
VGDVLLERIKRNPWPVIAAGLVVLFLLRRRKS